MASGKSEEDLLKEIAEKIAKNQVGFDSKKDEEKAELSEKIELVATSQMMELQKSFNTLMGNIKQEIPENARIVVLEGVMEKVESEKLKSIDTVFLSEEVRGYATTVVINAINNQKEPVEKKDDIAEAIIIKKEIEKNDEIGDVEYISNEEIKDKVESAINLVRKLDEEKIESLISEANGGDLKAKAEVMAIMSVSVFTQTNKTFEEMTENDKVRALTQIYSMATLNELINSENLIILAEELSKKWDVEFITEDANGQKIIDKRKIDSFAKENNINYGTNGLDSILESAKYYENLENYEDIQVEIGIEVAKININSNLDFVYRRIKEGGKLEDYSDELRDAFKCNFDASIRAIDESVLSWNIIEGDQASPEYIEFQLFLLQEGMNLYKNAKEGNVEAIIDSQVNGNFYGIIDKSISIMKKNKVQNKQLLDTMLELEPEITQKKLGEYEFFSNNEQENSPKDLTKEKPKTRIDNLLNSLGHREQIKGIENVLEYTTNNIANENSKSETKTDYAMGIVKFLENRENSYEEKERLARKKLFTTIISEGVYNENMLKSMIEVDSTTIKEIIDELIKSQNLRETDKLSTIMDLSNSLKQASNSKVISADKVNIEDVVKNVQEQNNLDRDSDDVR